MARTLLALYPRKSAHYDEMLTRDAGVRAHWQAFLAHLDALSGDDMRRRLERVDQRIQENGVTYNVYADQHGADRPWSLDPLPLIIPADEWAQIAPAVAQRARLMNALLVDLYGPQHLLAEGLLPPALVFGQHGFLWPCHGLRPAADRWLHHYAVDLARAPDGRWWVIADRTQAPSGAGYALENRLAVSRAFPDMFRALHVEPLADFFREQQEGLSALAPLDPGEQPHVVLLTPGPYNETYFEHTYLARYLGFPLVEGQDLTVRGDTVYLKTLRGLKRVHVILRRQDDDYCDPLALRGDSALGVPGLLNAARAGRVVMANALGSGLLGSSALMGFLPAICERLLGEPLRMPSVATWWCGEKPALDYVKKHFDRLVIKPTYPTQRMEPVFGSSLKGSARADMLRRIEARPHAYVAQEMIELSQAPTWSRSHDRRLLARPVGLRSYAVCNAEGDYRVMPGGLARVASGAETRVISMQRGGASKDAWVLSHGPVKDFSLIKARLGHADLVRAGANLSSRVVENLFWFGRYSERFDDTARLLRVSLARLVDSGGARTAAIDAALELAGKLEILPGSLRGRNDRGEKSAARGQIFDDLPAHSTAMGQESAEIMDLADGFADRSASAAQAPRDDADVRTDLGGEHRLLSAIHDPEQQGSLAAAIRSLIWAATQIRERLSLDHWHSLTQLQRELQAAQKQPPTPSEAIAFLDRVLGISSSLTGFVMDNMTRDDGWRFLIIGRRLERLGFLSRALSGFLAQDSAQAPGCLEWLLELADSIITYRSRYLRRPERLPVIDLLVFEDSNPHGVAFQAEMLSSYLQRTARELDTQFDSELADALQALRSFDLRRLEDDDARCAPAHPGLQQLVQCLWRLHAAAEQVSDVLSARYFTHVGDVGRQTMAF